VVPPVGHIPIEQFVSAPALADKRLLGQVALANPGRDYTDEDLELVERLADLYAAAIHGHWSREQLQAETTHLQRFHRVTVGHELDMIRLKAEVNALLKAAGKPQKYLVRGSQSNS